MAGRAASKNARRARVCTSIVGAPPATLSATGAATASGAGSAATAAVAVGYEQRAGGRAERDAHGDDASSCARQRRGGDVVVLARPPRNTTSNVRPSCGRAGAARRR